MEQSLESRPHTRNLGRDPSSTALSTDSLSPHVLNPSFEPPFFCQGALSHLRKATACMARLGAWGLKRASHTRLLAPLPIPTALDMIIKFSSEDSRSWRVRGVWEPEGHGASKCFESSSLCFALQYTWFADPRPRGLRNRDLSPQ